MADNLAFLGAVVQSTGLPAIIRATESGGVFTLVGVPDGEGDTAIVIPGIMQAAAQALAAPLRAKDNGDGTFSLEIVSA